MRIYKYSKTTKEYLGYMEAYLDPLESEKQGREIFVIPPYFTTVAPKFPKEDNAVVFNGTDWEEVEDFRGLKVYDKKTGKEIIITELGPISEIYQKEKPVFLEDLRAEKIKEINLLADSLQREVSVINGIKSSAATWVELTKNLSAFDLFDKVLIDEVRVTKEELQEVIKYFYIKSMLISEKKAQLLKGLSSVRSKKKLEEFIPEFNLDSDIKKLMKLSKEELNERFSK